MRKAPKRPISQPVSTLPEMDLNALDTTERVLEYCHRKGLINGARVNIEELIKQTPNLTLKKKPLSDGIDAYIRETTPGNYEIGVNSEHSLTRQRFSMAHEYAHYQLHRSKLSSFAEGERILHRSDERNSIEQQANSFAAELLMPEALFRDEVKMWQGSIKLTAARFGVSQLALRYRAKNLGMGGHGV